MGPNKIVILCTGIFILWTTLLKATQAQETLSFGTATREPLVTPEGTGFIDLVAKEVLRRVGKKLVVSLLPAERSLINANKGIEDGDLQRISGLSKKYPNLIRVEEPFRTAEFSVFTKQENFKPTDWKSLEPYNVGFLNGWKILEANVKNVKSITKVAGAGQLFALLENGRADVVIFAKWQGIHMVKKLGLMGIRILEPPLSRRPMFMYLHKKHKDLAPKIAAALRAMKSDGTYQDLYDKVLGVLLASSTN